MLRSPAALLLLALAVGACFLAGLLLDGATGGVILLAVAGILLALTVKAWPTVRRRGRPARVLVIAVVVGLAVAKLAGKA